MPPKQSIAYIANAAIPSRTANSVHVMKMCEAFAQQGHAVTLVVPDIGNSDLPESNPFTFYGVAHNFTINKLSSIKKFPLGFLNYYFAFVGTVKAFCLNFQIIYTRNLVVAVFCVFLRLPFILELHEKMSNKLTSMKIGRLLRIFDNSRLLKLIVITQPLKEYYEQIGCPSNKIMVLPDAVNFNPYEHIKPLKELPGRCRIGYIGSFYEGRGIELINEMSIHDMDNDYYLYGGNSEDIHLWQKKTRGRENIFFNPHVPPAEVPSLLASMDILLMPYQRKVAVSGNKGNTSDVMSPLKMFEYMASGRPIISSDIKVLREVLHDGENCLLVSPDSVDEWLAAVRRLKADQTLARKIASNAQVKVRQNYTWEKRAERIINSVKSLPLSRQTKNE